MGDRSQVLALLNRIDYPSNIDNLTFGTQYSVPKIATLRIFHKPSQNRTFETTFNVATGLKTDRTYPSSHHIRQTCLVILCVVGDAGWIDFSTLARQTFVQISVYLNAIPDTDALEGAVLDLITHTPREEDVRFRSRGHNSPISTDGVWIKFPHMRILPFRGTTQVPEGPTEESRQQGFS